MSTYEKRHSFRIMFLVSKLETSDRASSLLKEMGIPIHYRLHVEGTVSSEMMDILGLVDTDWSMVISAVPKATADRALKRLHRSLMLGTVNSGIGFTVPINGLSGVLYHMLSELESKTNNKGKVDNMANEFTHSAIITIVQQGYSDKVMNAARKAGAQGGTVLHSRKVGELETLNAWGLSLQEESDMVLIIADNKSKRGIMEAISAECGLNSEAKGMVIASPIDTVIGLREPDEDEE